MDKILKIFEVNYQAQDEVQSSTAAMKTPPFFNQTKQSRRAFLRTTLAATGALGIWGPVAWARTAENTRQATLRVNAERLWAHLEQLAAFGRGPGGTSRVAYSEADRQGRAQVIAWMRAAGLDVEIDAAANIIGRRPGREPDRPPLVMGSHIDTVPNGGNYDGTVGSLSAIEVAQTLREQGIALRHPLEVVIFQNEEGGLIGSRAWIGELPPEELDHVSHSGKTIREGIRYLGGDPDRLDEVVRRPGDIAAYLELHIEQGPVLYEEQINIGIVEGIVGIRWWRVTWEGMANHAGTTPMNRRRDALLAAARFIQAVNRIVTSEPGRQVGTVGQIEAHPGAPNVIPGRVVCSLELRDLEDAKIQRLYAAIEAEARAIARDSGVNVRFEPVNVNKPAPTDPRVRDVIEASARALNLSTKRMPSGAGHDAQDMARLGPTGMIFIPSVDGISHSPQEYSRPEDVANGANVLLHALLRLDEAPWVR